MKLGSRERSVLEFLHEYCGWRDHQLTWWVWDTFSNTRRIMKRLAEKGLAEKRGDWYRITSDGIKAIEQPEK